MKNIEFKAELRNIDLARSVCFVVGARALGVLLQTDEYVAVPEGRLKRRVERIEEGRLLRLAAEMRLPGRAWLQFEVEAQGSGSVIRQTASFDPRGEGRGAQGPGGRRGATPDETA